jgi:hypothetical protein
MTRFTFSFKKQPAATRVSFQAQFPDEILIALVVGTVLIAAVAGYFASHNISTQTELSRRGITVKTTANEADGRNSDEKAYSKK